MAAGRPRKPIERREGLKAGDGRGSHTGGKKSDEPELVEYPEVVVGELMPLPEDQAASTEIALPENVPPLPAGLMPRGEREWVNIWTAGRAWLHQSEDYHLVEMIARAYDEVVAYRAEIGTHLIVKGYNGQKTANPLIKEVREAERTIIKCLSLLGFSPSDRARLGLKAVQQAKGLQHLQKNAGPKE